MKIEEVFEYPGFGEWLIGTTFQAVSDTGKCIYARNWDILRLKVLRKTGFILPATPTRRESVGIDMTSVYLRSEDENR